jgi:hypothetical protein
LLGKMESGVARPVIFEEMYRNTGRLQRRGRPHHLAMGGNGDRGGTATHIRGLEQIVLGRRRIRAEMMRTDHHDAARRRD